jgi:hypothetical protein
MILTFSAPIRQRSWSQTRSSTGLGVHSKSSASTSWWKSPWTAGTSDGSTYTTDGRSSRSHAKIERRVVSWMYSKPLDPYDRYVLLWSFYRHGTNEATKMLEDWVLARGSAPLPESQWVVVEGRDTTSIHVSFGIRVKTRQLKLFGDDDHDRTGSLGSSAVQGLSTLAQRHGHLIGSIGQREPLPLSMMSL